MMDAAPKVDTFTFEKSFLEYSQVSQISSRDRAYVDEEPGLRPFYKYEPKYAKLKEVIQDKKNASIDRKLLVSVLLDQYKPFNISAHTKKNIDKLSLIHI